MGARGELFTTQIVLNNRTYFFNIKENRAGDVFLQIVESKSKNGEAFDRHQIAVFSEDMQQFCKGFETALAFIDKNQKERIEKKAAKKLSYRSKEDVPHKNPDVKRTGRIHVISKRNTN